jgi:hypothetical protein
MKKLLTKNVIVALVTLLTAIAGAYGYNVSTETQDKISEVAVEKLVPAEEIITPAE